MQADKDTGFWGEIKRASLWNKIFSSVSFFLVLVADLGAKIMDETARLVNKDPNLQKRHQKFWREKKLLDFEKGDARFSPFVGATIISSWAVVISIISLPFSILKVSEISKGEKRSYGKNRPGPIDFLVAKVTGAVPYPTDIEAMKGELARYIMEKMNLCDNAVDETGIERVKEIKQTLSVLSIGRIVNEQVKGLNSSAGKEKVIEIVDGLVTSEISRLGLKNTRVEDILLGKTQAPPAAKTSAATSANSKFVEKWVNQVRVVQVPSSTVRQGREG